MKKILTTMAFLLLCLPLFASKGYAGDGLELILFIVAILFLIAGILKGIDLLKKNGRMILSHVNIIFHRIFLFLWDHLSHKKRDKTDFSELAKE